jgi:hypothetical protein
MLSATPIEVMLAELAHLHTDRADYVVRFLGFVAETGCTLMAHYSRDGELGLNAGFPCDAQSRHRNRWLHYLVADLRKVEGAEALLLQGLIAERLCWDERPANPRETMRAVRDWLRAGGRLLLTPEGKLEEGGSVPPALITGTADEAAECRRAGRAYFEARHRWRAGKQITRAVRMLGRRTPNGWVVLEGTAA